MKIGVFYEHQLGRPHTKDAELQLVQDALEQIELADELGIQYAWEVEHHFLEEYSHSSAPEVFLGAASQRTKDIRLGHGVMLTSPLINHPARVAERISMLDLVSDGRVEFGSGESSSEAELAGFGINPEHKRAMWLEGLQVALRCMTETPFTGVDGRWVSMPPRNVIPKPKQRPHPPLWLACSRRDTILLAAQQGMGALSFAFIDPEEARSWAHDYAQMMADECVPVGLAVNPNLACVLPMMVHRDEDEAVRRGVEGGNFFAYSLGHYYVFGDHRPGQTNVWQEYLDRRAARGYDPDAVALAATTRREGPLGAKQASGSATGLRGAVGTPDQVREFLCRYEQAGVDQVIFVLQAGRNRHEHIMESLELFGREVLPEFRDRDEGREASRAAKWEPILDKALARRATTSVTGPVRDLGDYSFPAIPRRWAQASGSTEMADWLERFADDRATGVRDPSAGITG